MPVVSTTDAFTTRSPATNALTTSASAPSRLLFAGLVDDAAVFPPGLAPLDVAVREHGAHRRAWYADIIGPLLCPADRAAELVEHLHRAATDTPTPVTLVAPSVEASMAAADALAGVLSAELAALELPLPSADHLAATTTELERLAAWAVGNHPARPPALWVEIPRGSEVAASLSLLPGSVGAKLRVGGTEPPAFPDEQELAAFLATVADRGIRFKLTAGLHHAVRHTDPATGFEHHGFLNVICAVHAAQVAGESDLAGILAEREAAPLVDVVRGVDADDARRVRSAFASFGCCGVTDPVDDLVSLGLITAGLTTAGLTTPART